jgi:glycerophosphoryl diester phosphodiesterase
MLIIMRLLLLIALALPACAQTMLDAHNCYPYEGKYADRIDKALATRLPLAIEQDLSWFVEPNGKGRHIVVHNKPYSGQEPSMRTYFFEKVRPIMEQALRDNRKQDWPLITLNLDFKSTEPELLADIWNLLGEYESWLTTAKKDQGRVTPFQPGPLLVLTGSSENQKAYFYDRLAEGATLRLFGSAQLKRQEGRPRWDEAAAYLVRTPARELIAESATGYVRWVNFPWAVVEQGGQMRAADWTAADRARLDELTQDAHAKGLKIRFYTLNGHKPGEDLGWSAGYNFGSKEAAAIRWKAAIEAGVDYLATDQYSEFAAVLGESKSRP